MSDRRRQAARDLQVSCVLVALHTGHRREALSAAEIRRDGCGYEVVDGLAGATIIGDLSFESAVLVQEIARSAARCTSTEQELCVIAGVLQEWSGS